MTNPEPKKRGPKPKPKPEHVAVEHPADGTPSPEIVADGTGKALPAIEAVEAAPAPVAFPLVDGKPLKNVVNAVIGRRAVTFQFADGTDHADAAKHTNASSVTIDGDVYSLACGSITPRKLSPIKITYTTTNRINS
jgi:hypothetical protein